MPETPKKDVLFKKKRVLIDVYNSQPWPSIIQYTCLKGRGWGCLLPVFPDHGKHLVGFLIHVKMAVPSNCISIYYLLALWYWTSDIFLILFPLKGCAYLPHSLLVRIKCVSKVLSRVSGSQEALKTNRTTLPGAMLPLLAVGVSGTFKWISEETMSVNPLKLTFI